MIKLGVFDLDKTLLDANSMLPRDFYENVAILRERGVTVAIASGRPADSLLYLFHRAPDDMLICGEDGNLFFMGKELVKSHVMSWDLINEIYDTIKGRNDLAMMFSTIEGESFWDWHSLQLMGAWSGRRYRREDAHELDGTENICRIHCVTPGGDAGAKLMIEGPLAVLKDKCDVLGEGYGWIGIMEKGMNKAMAVKLFMEHLGIGPDEVAVFGDNENDVPMFSVAKYSYAMKNASPDIKKKAAFVTRYDHTVNGDMRQLLELTEGQKA